MSEEKMEEVRVFLKSFKKVAQQKGIFFVPRDGFLAFRAWLGFTIEDCIDELMGLTIEHYCEGPNPDNDMPGDVWVFGKDVGGIEIYIKLKLASAEEEMIAKCISFHPAKVSLTFPLK